MNSTSTTYRDRAATLTRMEIGESLTVPMAEKSKWRSAMVLAQRSGEYHFVSRTIGIGLSVKIQREG